MSILPQVQRTWQARRKRGLPGTRASGSRADRSRVEGNGSAGGLRSGRGAASQRQFESVGSAGRGSGRCVESRCTPVIESKWAPPMMKVMPLAGTVLGPRSGWTSKITGSPARNARALANPRARLRLVAGKENRDVTRQDAAATKQPKRGCARVSYVRPIPPPTGDGSALVPRASADNIAAKTTLPAAI